MVQVGSLRSWSLLPVQQRVELHSGVAAGLLPLPGHRATGPRADAAPYGGDGADGDQGSP